MGWFSRRKPKIEDTFEKIYQLMRDEQLQNDSLPTGLRQQIRWSKSVDKIDGGRGEFGLDDRNPIPVNGPIGESFYLSSLETSDGVPIAYQRLGSRNGLDIFETVSFDGRHWAMLFLDMYYPRKSRLAPPGYRLGKLDSIRGVSKFEETFPSGIVIRVAEETERRFGIALADPGLRKLEALSPERPIGSPVRLWIEDKKKKGAMKRAEIERRIGSFSLQTEDGSEVSFENWMTIQLAAITITACEEVRAEWEEQACRLLPSYWRECMYLALSMLSTALFRARFGGNPAEWSDKVLETVLPRLINKQIGGEKVEKISIRDAVLTLRIRMKDYMQHRSAFGTELTPAQAAAFAAHAAKNFCSENNLRLIPSSLMGLTTIAVTLQEQVDVLSEAFETEGFGSGLRQRGSI